MDIQKQRKRPFLSIFQNTEYGRIVQNGGDSHMEQTGMLVENFEFNP